MPRVSLRDPDLTYDEADPPGFRAGSAALGAALGAQDTGATLYELASGQSICPYHYEYGEEEWLLVLEGEPTLRTPEGLEALAPLDLAFFPKGPDGAHEVRNDGAGDGAGAAVVLRGLPDCHGVRGLREGRRLHRPGGGGPHRPPPRRRRLLRRRAAAVGLIVRRAQPPKRERSACTLATYRLVSSKSPRDFTAPRPW